MRLFAIAARANVRAEDAAEAEAVVRAALAKAFGLEVTVRDLGPVNAALIPDGIHQMQSTSS
jgi:hypothetical protein